MFQAHCLKFKLRVELCGGGSERNIKKIEEEDMICAELHNNMLYIVEIYILQVHLSRHAVGI